MKLKKSIVAAAALGMALVASQARADLDISVFASKQNVSLVEAAGAITLAEMLGLDATLVVSTGKSLGVSVYDLGPAFVMSSHCGVPVPDLWHKHKKGRGWGIIAKDHGIHPGAFNKTRVWLDRAHDNDVYSALWGNMLYSRYGVPYADVSRWRASGIQWGDMVIAVTIAKDRGVKPDVVFTSWKKSKDWNKVWKEHPGKGKTDDFPGKGKGGS
ncbi:MAG: hypothetical protein C4341_07305 [Armatimonadota bacterium]